MECTYRCSAKAINDSLALAARKSSLNPLSCDRVGLSHNSIVTIVLCVLPRFLDAYRVISDIRVIALGPTNIPNEQSTSAVSSSRPPQVACPVGQSILQNGCFDVRVAQLLRACTLFLIPVNSPLRPALRLRLSFRMAHHVQEPSNGISIYGNTAMLGAWNIIKGDVDLIGSETGITNFNPYGCCLNR